MRTRFCQLLAVLAVSAVAVAQGPAPRDNPTVMLAGGKVSIDYGRPSLKGRSFDELTKDLPEDRMWRAGSDQVTTLTTDTDLLIGGKKIPAGKYSLYVHCPENGVYSLTVNEVLGQPLKKIFPQAPPNLADEPWPHFAYAKEIGDKEVARVPMKKAEVTTPEDLFTITLTPADDGATMRMAWGDRAWVLDIQAAK